MGEEDLRAVLGERSGQREFVGMVAVGLDARSSILVTRFLERS